LVGFLHFVLETRWQQFGQFLNDLLKGSTLDCRDFILHFRKIAPEIQHKIAIFVENRNFGRKSATKIAKKSCWKSDIKSFTTKLELLQGLQKLAGWGGSFSMVYRNNTGRLGAGFISVRLETRWLGHLGGFYVSGCYCTASVSWKTIISVMLKGVFQKNNSCILCPP